MENSLRRSSCPCGKGYSNGGSIISGAAHREEDLSSIIKELNDNQEENMICKMDKNGKCVGLKPFMDKIMKMKDRMKVMHKNLLQKILKVLKESKSYKKALLDSKVSEQELNVYVHHSNGEFVASIY